jgi:hypothetical protein
MSRKASVDLVGADSEADRWAWRSVRSYAGPARSVLTARMDVVVSDDVAGA